MQVDNPRKRLESPPDAFSAKFLGNHVCGITGTNGKTTTAYLFQNLLGKLFGAIVGLDVRND